jgi:hypothetical protein
MLRLFETRCWERYLGISRRLGKKKSITSSFIIFTEQILLGWWRGWDNWGMCHAGWRRELCTWFWLESSKERDILEERGKVGRIILKWSLREKTKNVEQWTGRNFKGSIVALRQAERMKSSFIIFGTSKSNNGSVTFVPNC